MDEDEELPEKGAGAGPLDLGEPVGQYVGYEEVESLDPDESLLDPESAQVAS